jgi:hypothetical protein
MLPFCTRTIEVNPEKGYNRLAERISATFQDKLDNKISKEFWLEQHNMILG